MPILQAVPFLFIQQQMLKSKTPSIRHAADKDGVSVQNVDNYLRFPFLELEAKS